MREHVVWINGRIVEPHCVQLRADDHGVLVGDGVFETLLVVADGSGSRATFALRRHLERLRKSAEVLRINCPYSDGELREAVQQCLAAAPGAGVVRITLTSGGGPLGSGRGDDQPTVIVIAGDTPPLRPPGTAVTLVPYVRNERGAMSGVKTISYAENVLALYEARQRGSTEAIFADTQGRVSEGTGSNIFWSDGRCLHTPPLDTGCLAGVTRELVMEQVEVVETHLQAERLCEVPEAFLTSSLRGVQSIGRIDNTVLPVVDGELTTAAANAVTTLMATQIDP